MSLVSRKRTLSVMTISLMAPTKNRSLATLSSLTDTWSDTPPGEGKKRKRERVRERERERERDRQREREREIQTN